MYYQEKPNNITSSFTIRIHIIYVYGNIKLRLVLYKFKQYGCSDDTFSYACNNISKDVYL